MSLKIEMIGRSFGSWVVVECGGSGHKGEAMWLCRCVCGFKKQIRGSHLRQGQTMHCGCLTFGNMKSRSSHPLWSTYQGIRQRCTNPNYKGYKNYGGRGIYLCERWNQFQNFVEDMGPKPSSGHSIERKDNMKGYSPDNCVWATSWQQNRNTRHARKITFNGVCRHLTDWCKELGIKDSTLHWRLRNWDFEKSMSLGKQK
jgi:hypothetical protein